MAIDHSITYKKFSLKNLPHILRLNSIKNTVKKLPLPKASIYFDVGCSNGYITHQISEIISASQSTGWDHSEDNISKAKSDYPQHDFRTIDLNIPNTIPKHANFITCFETMEHVGNITEAINNIDNMTSTNAIILYSVPIESGFIGSIKYFIKKYIFNYSLKEISDDKDMWKKYEKSLFAGEDISIYRDQRNGWATHYGFDYRNFEALLKQKYTNVKAWTSGTTRFVLIKTSTK